ncbi:MBL fold metallo-hydrolase [Microbacterium horticulturae]|uniref:MBL fold metallo-hydrolase n=1 Tax=Microbacterium horticulturae TaxID=3028316 RepID=A0ABY8C3Y7_9MICO|nr:MBL fold metallo-hydrolase [Microbacterium sp. KACC 23027]WEG09781.1 MBL fold metallo-hydrolase [Microbacterium sp. KACC 23027]
MTHIVTLGTAGGPRWWTPAQAEPRFGIATAVVVGDRSYLVDAGLGAGRQFTRAGLTIDGLGGVFLTHLHSDHTTDLANIALFGMFGLSADAAPIPILGPGDRGALPPLSPRAARAPRPVAPHLPTPGTRDVFRLLMEAHATDLNDRVLDALRPSPFDLFAARDIEVPASSGYHPNERPTPAMKPFTVFEDDRVRVDAILVEHPPIAPAFGYRFTTDEGSVAISGDTAKTENMVRLAEDVDLLLHEAISFDWVEQTYGDPQNDTARASHDHHHKSHTSVVEAAEIAAAAGARSLAVHHLVPGSLDTAAWHRAALRAEAATGTPVLVPDDLERLSFARAAQRLTA